MLGAAQRKGFKTRNIINSSQQQGRPPASASPTAAAAAKKPAPEEPRRLWYKLWLLTWPWFISSGLFAFLNLIFSFVSIASMYIVLQHVGDGGSDSGSDDNGGDGSDDKEKDDDDDDDDGGMVAKAAVLGLFLGPLLAAVTTVLQQHLPARRHPVARGTGAAALPEGPAHRPGCAGREDRGDRESHELRHRQHPQRGRVHPLDLDPFLAARGVRGLLNIFIGAAFWGAVVFMVAVVPIYGVLFRFLSSYQKELQKCKDARLEVITEVLAGVRIIKLCALEKGFLDKIQRARLAELAQLRKFLFTLTGVFMVILTTPSLTGMATVVTATQIMHRSVDAATAFTTLALLDLLRASFTTLPYMLNQLIQAKVSSAAWTPSWTGRSSSEPTAP